MIWNNYSFLTRNKLEGIRLFFDFTDPAYYQFNPDNSVAKVFDTVSGVEMIVNSPNAVYDNTESALYLPGYESTSLPIGTFGDLQEFDLLASVKIRSDISNGSTRLMYAQSTSNANLYEVAKHGVQSFGHIEVNSNDSNNGDNSTDWIYIASLDVYQTHNIKHDGTNVYAGIDTNTLTDRGVFPTPADNLETGSTGNLQSASERIGVVGWLRYLVLFETNITDAERVYYNNLISI